MTTTRCLIIGSGPAGYTAGIYTGRADLKPLLYEGLQPGGQLTITTEIENFPGYPEGISGTAMMEDLRKQALRFGTEMRQGTIEKIDLSHRPFVAVDDKGEQIEAETVIVATGASARWLGLESEKQFYGQGVSACATCDGFFYKNLDVAVVGGGDTACEEASYLATLCNKVYMIVRRDELRASKAMQHRVLTNPKIEMLWNSVTQQIVGTDMDGVVGAELKNVKTGEVKRIDIAGFFVAIGHQPNTAFLDEQLELDEAGYIKVQNPSSATSVPGVFAAGDVCDPNYRQACVAAAKGCVAGIDVERFLHS
ncbi:MAG: thioredoxin-disulfide reductase [Bacteroidales bacterium]|jgi:thioredoxin reductase (NADPH)|nr:thioredoxin-disulfide reductase [Bacteroidales bacterium]